MSEDGTVTTTLDEHVLTITVDREAKMNSFTPAMFDQLSDAMTELEQSDAALVSGVVTVVAAGTLEEFLAYDVFFLHAEVDQH